MSILESSFQSAVELLRAARSPVILIGPEGASAAHELLGIADRLGAAVLTTPDAISIVDWRRSCGTFSFGASALGRRVMERADVVLAVSALGEFSCRLGEAFRRHTLIQVTEQVTDVGRNLDPTVSLVGPGVHATVARLHGALVARVPIVRAAWFAALDEERPAEPRLAVKPGLIHPRAAIAAIEAALPESARVCLDVTSGALYAYERLKVTTSQRVFSSIENGACMGEALMASLGVRLASNEPTLTLVGDWGYCMAPSEVHAAVELELDRYVVLIWANGGGAFIGAGVAQQNIRVPDRVWRWNTPPDFAQIARGYRARGVTVRDAEALQAELARALRGAGPTIIEAKIDPTIPIPAGDRFLTLGDARS